MLEKLSKRLKTLGNKTKIMLALLLVLVAVRLALPYFITKHLNKVLDRNIAPYQGHIYDVDLSLYRGAYRICDLRVDLVDENGKRPFIHAPHMDLSIEWKSLLSGSIVGEVVMESPEINFKLAPKNSQTGKGADWVQLVKDFMPVKINRFAVEKGRVAFLYLDGKNPGFNVDFENFQLEVRNIRNVEDNNDALPSPVVATANAPGNGGQFAFTADANFLREVPNFNYNAKFENAELKSVNEVLRYLTKGVDFESGKLSLYSEMAMKDGEYRGYLKPILLDAKIFKWKEEDRSFLEGVKELVAEGVQELFENHKKDQSASRVSITGRVDSKADTDILQTIVSALSNAYIKAFKFQLDNTIDYANTFGNEKKAGKDKDG